MTTYDSNAPSLEESSGCLSIDDSSTASRATFPPHLAHALPLAATLNTPAESHKGVNSIQGSTTYVDSLYTSTPNFNPQLWSYPAFSIPQFANNLPNTFMKPLGSVANNDSFPLGNALPYDQYIPPFGLSEGQFSQW
jgi:hypothetical protein